MLSFREEQQRINEEYNLDASDQVDAANEARQKHYEKLGLTGAYHLWEDGYEQGDATEEDIITDAKTLKIDINRDVEDITEDLFEILDNTYLEIYESEAQKIIERIKMIEKLKEIGSLALDSKEFKKIMPEVHFFLEEKFEGFAADPSNETTEEGLRDFQNGEYLVEILFKEDEVVYFVGEDAQQLSNEPSWAEDRWDDIETETLVALLKAAK